MDEPKFEDIKSSEDLWEEWQEEQDRLDKAVIIKKNCYILDNGAYIIEMKRCNSASKLLGWIHHLSEKIWFDVKIMRRFITIVSENSNIEIDYNC